MATTNTVLITGGAGFIGSHLADALLGLGCRVRIFDNLEPQVHGPSGEWPTYLAAGVECLRGDVRDRAALASALHGVDVVYHLAAATGVGQSMYQVGKYFEVNVQGTANLLDILANEKHTVKRLVLSSSRAVYGEGAYICLGCGIVHPPVRAPAQLDAHQWEVTCPQCQGLVQPAPTPESLPPDPGSMYAVTKHAQEQMVACFSQAYGLPAVLLRFFNVYGPRQSLSNPYTGILTTFLQHLRNGHAPEIYEDGGMTRDFVNVADVVRACMLAGEEACPAGVYNIGSGQAVTILQLAQNLAQAEGSPLQPQVVGLARVGDIRHCTADLEKAQRLLGYYPQVSLAQGLARLVQQAQGLGRDQSLAARSELERAGLLRA
ncbi:MAG: NAD-dependent epimerase/dehydratase family protein [Anaerolineales bacterium]|nr:NAD-dependent epimerase/dehydratase family protein [Anaerolineales bacterium]